MLTRYLATGRYYNSILRLYLSSPLFSPEVSPWTICRCPHLADFAALHWISSSGTSCSWDLVGFLWTQIRTCRRLPSSSSQSNLAEWLFNGRLDHSAISPSFPHFGRATASPSFALECCGNGLTDIISVSEAVWLETRSLFLSILVCELCQGRASPDKECFYFSC